MIKSKRKILDMNGVDTNDENTLFVSTFDNFSDKEIVSILCSWLNNGYANEDFALKKLIIETMNTRPTEYVMSYDDKFNGNNMSFFNVLTFSNIDFLIKKIKKIIIENSTLLNQFETISNAPRNKCKYVHDVFALMLGGNTGFPTIQSNGTFFRYNYLFYLLSRKLNIWNFKVKQSAIIPCNDEIFEKAKLLGVTKRRLNSNLKSAVELTDIAKYWFDDVFGMYEYLKYHDGV